MPWRHPRVLVRRVSVQPGRNAPQLQIVFYARRIQGLTSRKQTVDAKQLGASVREARKSHGLSHQSAARAAKCSVQFLVDLEQGKPTIQLDKALATAHFFGIVMQPGVDDLAQRRCARFAALEKKAAADAKLRGFHETLLARLRQDPVKRDKTLAKAMARVNQWEQDALCSPEYISRWRVALNGGLDVIQTRVLDDPVWSTALVQNSPFGFLMRRKPRRA